MRVLRFQVRDAQGRVDSLNVEGDRAMLGSGAHCEIRLPVDEARVEHVLIELGPAGIFARALSFEPSPTINNVPFQQAPLPPGAVLGVGNVQILVDTTEGGAAGTSTSGKKRGSPLAVVALLIMGPAAAYLILADDDPNALPKLPPRTAPELWEAPVTTCNFNGGQALAFARERMAVADAKRERRPFHVQDGVQAVPIYESAGACFRTGGDPGSAGLADDSAKFLRREMNDDFRTRRVRLEHALNVDDTVTAQKEVRVLLQFTENKSGDYVTWLSNLDRRLKLKATAKKS